MTTQDYSEHIEIAGSCQLLLLVSAINSMIVL